MTAHNQVDVGTGTTVTLASTGWYDNVKLTNIQWTGASRGDVEITPLNVAAPAAGKFGNREFIPTDGCDPGSLIIEGYHDPEHLPPIQGAKGAITVQWLNSGDTVGATWVVDGYCNKYDVDIPFDEAMKFVAEFKLSGNTTVAASG